jgi:hypothetical protein
MFEGKYFIFYDHFLRVKTNHKMEFEPRFENGKCYGKIFMGNFSYGKIYGKF